MSRVNPYTPASVLELAVKGKIVIGSVGKTKYQIVCTRSRDWPFFSLREDFVHMRANSSFETDDMGCPYAASKPLLAVGLRQVHLHEHRRDAELAGMRS
jgi:hypothetical protein